MTKEEAIKELSNLMKDTCGAKYTALSLAISALQQEKEPAPSANDASAVISISINDNMKVYARIYSKNNKGKKTRWQKRRKLNPHHF